MPIFLYSGSKIIGICWDDNFDEYRVKKAVYDYNYIIGSIYVAIFSGGNYSIDTRQWPGYDYIDADNEEPFKCKFDHDKLEILEEKFPWFLQLDNVLNRLKDVTGYKDFLEEFREDVYNYIANNKVLYQKAIQRWEKLFSESSTHHVTTYYKR
jgi:hypothetical protein